MGIATNWLLGQLAPLVQRVTDLEAKPALSEADRATLAEARALLDEMGAAPAPADGSITLPEIN